MSVRPLYQKTPSHSDRLSPKETVLSHNKVTDWSVNLPIAKTCHFSKGGSSWPASLTKQVRVYNSIKGDTREA